MLVCCVVQIKKLAAKLRQEIKRRQSVVSPPKKVDLVKH